MTKKKVKKQMSTFADRPTVGQLLNDTHEQHSKQKLEVGEFIDEYGQKEVMKELWRQIDERKELPHWQPVFYLLVYMRKDPYLKRVLRCDIQSRHTKPSMEPNLVCYSYHSKNDELRLDWILPNESAFKMYLGNKSKTDPFLFHCIEQYLAGKETGYIKV